MKKRYAAAVLCIALMLPLASCGEKPEQLLLPGPEACAYAAGTYADEENTVNVNAAQVNTYGNMPYATLAVNRRTVQAADVLYTAVNDTQALQKVDAKGKVTTLFDGEKVGNVSYYAGHVYFSDYVAITEPYVRGEFYCTKLYRLDVSGGAKEPELIYQSKIELERFASFQLCNGYLYLTGSRAYSTFGVKRLGLDGKADGKVSATLLSDTSITAAQVSGASVYYLIKGTLYVGSLRGVERAKLMEDSDISAFCVVEDTVYFVRDAAPGVHALSLETKETSVVRAKGDVEAFFSVSGDGAPDCFVIKPLGAESNDKRQLVYQSVGGESVTLAEDVMPAGLSFMQPFCEGGKVYYFDCGMDAMPRIGYIRAVDPLAGKTELCYEWVIEKPSVEEETEEA